MQRFDKVHLSKKNAVPLLENVEVCIFRIDVSTKREAPGSFQNQEKNAKRGIFGNSPTLRALERLNPDLMQRSIEGL